ncbi:hypothetical protein AAG906_003462 [Vitis piasezkii]
MSIRCCNRTKTPLILTLRVSGFDVRRILVDLAISVTLNVRSSVVDDLSPYNAIMGRAWLHKMKVIPSTYHQMVSYLMKEGQIDLLASQLVARQCNQVALESRHPLPDEKKTTFVTPQGLYCYRVMSFELKNADASYQRLMTKIFKPLIARTMEVYIDDIVVKSKTQVVHVQHLEEAFQELKLIDSSESRPQTPTPNNKKELQCITDHLATLGCFLVHFTNKSRPFFLTLKGTRTFD